MPGRPRGDVFGPRFERRQRVCRYRCGASTSRRSVACLPLIAPDADVTALIERVVRLHLQP